MTYISVNFIYFLIVFLLIYSIVPNNKLKQAVVLIGNLCFYIWAGKGALCIVLVSAALVYLGTRIIDKIYTGYRGKVQGLDPVKTVSIFKEYKKKTIYIVITVLSMLLLVFTYVKIGRYMGLESVPVTQFSLGKNIIVPVGLSYYTLSMIGYLVDVYKDRVVCEKNFFTFLTCVTYFPHIIQGPISRYGKLIEQLRALPSFSYERMCSGLQLMLWGYLKKLVLADTIYLYTTAVFSNVAGYSIKSVIAATVLYAIQLYADFSGCIDISQGIAEVMGIQLDKNFVRPFFSQSAGEFWRRWHISLGVWFKEYIYMPIATAGWFKKVVKKIRKSRGRQWGLITSVAVPSLAVWLLTGIWHGTGADYIIWGLYWGIIIIFSEVAAEKYDKIKKRLHIKDGAIWYRIFQSVRTFGIYCVGLSIIMKSSVAYVAGNIVRTSSENMIIILGTIFLLMVECFAEYRSKKGETIREFIAKRHLIIRWTIYFAGLFILIIYGRFGIGYNADSFIYAGF